MFLPIGDRPNLDKTPWLTWGLIAINVAIYLVLWPLGTQSAVSTPAAHELLQVLAAERGIVPQQLSQLEVVRFEHGFKPGAPTWADAFSSMFLHGGLAHLLGNMLFLWIFGDNVEHRLGGWRFLLAYLGTGLLAVGGDSLLRWGSSIPSVGASGAISGVLGLYFAWFPRNRVRVFVFLFPIFLDVIELSARFVLGAYLVVNNLLPALFSAGGGVSYGAHIGGFIGGWALARLLPAGLLPAGPNRSRARPKRQRAQVPRDGLQASFRQAMAAGRNDQAAAALFEAPRSATRTQLSIDDKIALGEAMERAGRHRVALSAFQRALADHPVAPGRTRAHLGAARVLMRGLGSPTAAYQHLYDVMEGQPTAEEQQQAQGLLTELQRGVRSLPRRRW